ncbi:MAG: Glutathione-binding protein GsiB [Syntrophomonadaceae bacterium]|nr:Glutathione-binding protein GsiB [Bacillota bacterium]
MLKRLTVLTLCFLMITAVFTGCGRQAADTPQDVPKELAALQQVVAGLGRDPGEMYGYGAHPSLTRVLEPLIFRDLDLGLIPGLAVKWDVSGDGLSWIIQLREGVQFHDGTPFNADAVIHNLWRILKMSPERFGSVEKIEALEELKIEVTHSEPFVPFLYSLAWPGAAMISPNAVNEDGSIKEPIGTGPFVRESWTSGEDMVLARNDGYWGGVPILERITLKYIPDPSTRMMALEAGEIDMIIDTGGVLPEQVPTLLLHPEIEVLTTAGAVPHYMTLNTREWPFNDQQVRKAVMYAVDPESIIQHALEGYGKVMTTVIPHSEKNWMHADALYEYNNPDKAKELLKQAGWVDSGSGILQKNGQELRVKFLLSSALARRWPYATIAEIVQAQLRDVGIGVEIKVVEAGLWRETLQKGEANMSIRPWAGISPQCRLYDWLHSKGENTAAMGIFFNNPQIDGLIETLLRTTDEKVAKELAFRIQEIASVEVPIIPIYDEVLINAVRGNIKGYKLHPWFTVNWEDIYVESLQ